MFTDMEGSTRLLQRLGDGYHPVLREHHRILREAVESAGGVPFGTEGDALFAAFSSASSAVAAAVAAQKELAAHAWPEGVAVRVRMGLHAGDGVVHDGAYVGIDLHRTARIAAAGHGGQILISDPARALVEQSLPAGVELRDLGRHRLKDLAQPERIFDVAVAGLPSQFPPLRSLDAMPNNLPTQLTSFIGRTREVADVRRLLATTRLLTLTGPGGTGKTRLSLQVAAESIGEFADGVFFAPLGPVEDPAMVGPAILAALSLRESPSQPPLERLIDYLRDRRLLLVLDNFEQVLPAAELVGELLRGAAGIKIVVTSRATLHIYGEKEYEVPPLAVPSLNGSGEPSGTVKLDLAALARFESVALFVERASAARPDFTLNEANAAAIAAICARLDGLPLAIELVAARIKLLPPAALLARLGSRLDLLDARSRDLPARQQTLRGAIAWSYDLLGRQARQLFECFSVFVGGASLEAAESICGGDGLDVLDGLSSLVDHSLIRQEEVEGEPRFTMLFVIREFAREKLAEREAAEAGATPGAPVATVGEGHAAFFLAMAEGAAPGLTGPDQRRLLDAIDRENGNMRAALTWSIEHGAAKTALRLGSALWRFWQMRGLLQEGTEWLERILAMPGLDEFPVEHARALEAAGGVAYWRALMPTATVFYEAALALCREIGDRRDIANALYNVGFPSLVSKANMPRARAALEESLELYRELDDRPMIARVLWGLGNTYYFAHDYAAAVDVLLEDVAIFRTLTDPFGLAWALHTLGLSYLRLGKADPNSGPLWREAMGFFEAARDVSGITILLRDFSQLAQARGDVLTAVRLNAASTRLGDRYGTQLGSLLDVVEQDVPDLTGVDPVEVQAAIAEGQRMTVEEAVAHALRLPG